MDDIHELKGLLIALLKEIRKMAVDFSKLDSDVQALIALVKSLQAQIAAIPPSSDPTTQAHIDSLAATIEAALPAPAAPTGTTGPSA